MKIENLNQSMDGKYNSGLTKEERQKKRAETEVNVFNKEHGKLNEVDNYNCDICHNTGLLAKVEYTRYGYQAVIGKCACMEIRNSIKRYKNSGLGDALNNCTFEKFKVEHKWQEVVKTRAMKFVSAKENWFFIGGQSGVGKTFICTAIAAELLKKGKKVKYMLWRDEIVQLKSNVNNYDIYTGLINLLKNVDVLYIDDLFKTGKDYTGEAQKPTAADINIAFEILNYRLNNSTFKTIISSECTVKDIINIDEALGGRIIEKAFDKGFGTNIRKDKSKNYRLRNLCEL